jgi:hypothetical protein
MIRNNGTYFKQAVINTGQFVYYGTTALKRGRGMCYDLDYLTTSTGELAADAFGARGLKVIAVPSASNANRFAGVLAQDVKADSLGRPRLVTLQLPGGCAEIAQRVISTSGVGRVTCIVDRTAGQGLSGLFGWGGLNGKGSAVPLQTLAAATLGNLAITNSDGTTGTGVYSAATGLTTVSLTGAGTALGYVSAAVDASDYELTVLGGATAATGTTRCTPGIYPVYQATGANTFTVTGNTGDGVMTTFLTKVGLLMLAYLEDGEESGCADYVTPITGAASQFPLNQGGTTFILGGITIAADCTVNTLASPNSIGGNGHGARKAFNCLGAIATANYLATVTAGEKLDGTTDISTLSFNAADEHTVLTYRGSFAAGTTGRWGIDESQGTTIT